jgi:DNA topoisomerase-2
VEKLLAEQAAKEEEWNILLKRKPIELWDDDLDQFLKAWEVSSHDHWLAL